TAIAISAILLTSFTMVGMQYSHHAMAQVSNATSPSGNATGAAPSGNATGGPSGNATGGPSGNATATSAQEPPIGQSFVITGTKSSQVSPLPGKKDQLAAILVPRADDGIYSGVL